MPLAVQVCLGGKKESGGGEGLGVALGEAPGEREGVPLGVGVGEALAKAATCQESNATTAAAAPWQVPPLHSAMRQQGGAVQFRGPKEKRCRGEVGAAPAVGVREASCSVEVHQGKPPGEAARRRESASVGAALPATLAVPGNMHTNEKSRGRGRPRGRVHTGRMVGGSCWAQAAPWQCSRVRASRLVAPGRLRAAALPVADPRPA